MKPRIAIDLGGLDGLRPGAGLFRYAVDLIRALHSLWPTASFHDFGSFPTPIQDLVPVFAGSQTDWVYRHLPRATRLPAELRRRCGAAAAVAAVRADLYNCLHTFIPLPAPCPLVVTIHDLMYELFPEYQEAVRSRPYRLLRWGARRRARRIICGRATCLPTSEQMSDTCRSWQLAGSARAARCGHSSRTPGWS